MFIGVLFTTGIRLSWVLRLDIISLNIFGNQTSGTVKAQTRQRRT